MDSTKLISYDDKTEGYFSNIRHEMLNYIPRNAKIILDVGCGVGVFGNTLKEEDSTREVWGIELEKKYAVIAVTRLNKVLTGDIMSLLKDIPDYYFDCIVFNDVLEHLVDPFTVLKDIKVKLKDDGVVVCSIPNLLYADIFFDLLKRKKWEYKDFGVLDRTHLRFFTKKTLINMFPELGYNLIKIEGINKIKSRNFKLFNFLTFYYYDECKYMQFACVAKK
jgi:2-polyprenyl-3-methyl-5-hydroxy-6-metoxy-1,4-benzoquinol methylase